MNKGKKKREKKMWVGIIEWSYNPITDKVKVYKDLQIICIKKTKKEVEKALYPSMNTKILKAKVIIDE